MLRLVLMRHAKSDWSHPELSDHDRPLNTRGKASAIALGNWMRAKDYTPHQVFCSSAQRTGETLLGLKIKPEPNTQFTRTLYHADASAMLEVLHQATELCVLMIGHNPGICELAHRLVDEPPLHARFEYYPTGATLVCDFDVPKWRDVGWYMAKPVDFVIPREITEA